MGILKLILFYIRIYVICPITLVIYNRTVCPACGTLQRNYELKYFMCHNPDCALYKIRVFPNGEVDYQV